MQIRFSKDFSKKYDKVDWKIRNAVDERLDVFVKDKFHPLLNNHALSGEYEGCRSINITGNYRVIFKEEKNEDIILFLLLGTHTELYK